MNKNILITTILVLSVSSFVDSQEKWDSYSRDPVIIRKVDSVLRLMNLEEKIGQLSQYTSQGDVTGPVVNADIEPLLKKGLVGSIFNATTSAGVRHLQELALSQSRLKIPVIFGYDVIHGYKTIFPMPLAESCSWDLVLMKKSAAISAEEAAAEGVNWTFAPMVDIARDARWGRVMEGAGEDPYLGSLIARARVQGFQGEKWTDLQKTNTVLACAKHFAAYGAVEAGRDYNIVDISERTLREIYLRPFKAAKDAGVATFMTSFNEIAGVPSTASKFLFTDILKKEWNFEGFVVTDYTAINELVPHGVAGDLKQAGELAINAGIDMDMTGGVFQQYLPQLIKEGKVNTEQIDDAVRRILEMKFLLGLFDDPYRYVNAEREKAVIMKPEFLNAAREAAKRSVVLLKNNKQLFPVKPDRAVTIALIGPMVKNKESMNGEWAGRGDRNKSVSLFE